MLNIEFAQPGWHPDPSDSYQASPLVTSRCTGFTYLMSMVMSGHDIVTGRLTREVELKTFLAIPENTSECRRVNSNGCTALMLAVRNCHTDSTEETVASLLAHESSGEVARMTMNNDGWTALCIAVRYSRTVGERVVAMLLSHESSTDVARMSLTNGCTPLMLAAYSSRLDSTEQTVAMLLAHESVDDVIHMKDNAGSSALSYAIDARAASTDATADMLCERANVEELTELNKRRPDILIRCFTSLRQRLRERETLKSALQQGISLPGATVLLYI